MKKSYDWIKECYYRTSAKAFITNKEGKILLCKEASGVWDIPGWWIDHGEEILDALEREIQEEMWLKVQILANFPKYVFSTESSGIWSPQRPILLLLYPCEVENLNYTASDECTEIWFFSPSEALNNIELYHPNIKVMRELKKEQI